MLVCLSLFRDEQRKFDESWSALFIYTSALQYLVVVYKTSKRKFQETNPKDYQGIVSSTSRMASGTTLQTLNPGSIALQVAL